VRFEQLSSFLLSLCLHLALVVLALFWPAPKAPVVEPAQGRFVSGLVSIGKEGKNLPGSKPALPEASRGHPEKASTIDKPPADTQVKSVPRVNAPDKLKPKPNVRSIEKPAEQPPPNTVAVPKHPEKTGAKTADAAKAEKPVKNAASKKPGDTLAEALNSLDRDISGNRGKNSARGTTGGKGQDLSSVLSALGEELGSAGTAEADNGQGGDRGDAYGVLGSYQESIVSRVSANWAWPGRSDRKKYTTVVNIQIDPDGTIKNARIVSSSGNAYFDATVLQAVAATNTLEPPPRPDCADIDIRFTPEALGAR
jgi:TonB family protein